MPQTKNQAQKSKTAAFKDFMKDKVAILVIGILIGIIISLLGFLIYNGVTKNNGPGQPGMMGEGRQDFGPFGEEKMEKETKAGDINAGQEVTSSKINLSQYDSNITIAKAGEYTLEGNFKHSVLVNADGDVTLTLSGVNIQSDITAAIANIGKGGLTIKLADGTENILADGGASEYDACVYSNGKLIIEGDGTLNVYGNQEEGEGIATETNDITINGGTINIESEDDGINAGGDGGVITINGGDIYIKANGDGIDSNKNLIINGGNVYTMGSAAGGDAGIDTDDGFEINGGTVIALGSDMLERPEKSSKQHSAIFELNSRIASGAKISLKNENNEEIVTFEAKEDFRTLIISSPKLTSGTYYLYKDGAKTSYTAKI